MLINAAVHSEDIMDFEEYEAYKQMTGQAMQLGIGFVGKVEQNNMINVSSEV